MALPLIVVRRCPSAFPSATGDANGLLYMAMATFKDPCEASARKCGDSIRKPGPSAIPPNATHRFPGGPLFFGYPRKAHGKIDWHLGYRLANHLKHHRSQRPYQLPEGVTYYQHIQTLGLQFLRLPTRESR